MRKDLNDEQTRLARRFSASTKTEGKIRTTKRPGWTDELRYLPHASSGFPVVFLVLPGSP